MNGKLESRRASDSDFVIPVHVSKLDVLDTQSTDFEDRIRILEKYQYQQKGFNAANKLWITLGVTFIISTIVNVLIKVYIK